MNLDLRRRHFLLIFLGCLFWINTLTPESQGQAQSKPAKNNSLGTYPPTFESAKREIYKSVGDVQVPLYIFQPPTNDADKPRAAIVFFFGGGWSSGTPQQFEQHCLYLAARGLVAITADYRVASRHDVKAIECVRDGQCAIRWVRQNADRFNINPNQIVAAGGSAGGHIAACAGLIDDLNAETDQSHISTHPNALALFNPAVVLANVDGKENFFSNKNIANRTGVKPKDLSPYHHISAEAPPTIIFHGTGDTTVPYWTVKKFTQSMHEKGNRCELKFFADQPHGFFNHGRGNGSNYLTTLRQLDEFLVSLNYLPKPTRVNPLQPITDIPGLPRVLLIGDSISIGYTLPVRQLLEGQANVHRPAENGGPTTNGLTKLDKWLGNGKWDVIHWNFGLHDLKFMGPDGHNLADPNDPTSKLQVSPDDYKHNLQQIVDRLKQTGAKLIWRNTTPVPPGAKGRIVGDAVRYNEIASQVMRENNLASHDLYEFALSRMDTIMLDANVHFTPAGYEQLAGEVASKIKTALRNND